MPRSIVPSECKRLRTLNINITSTSEEEIWKHLTHNFKEFEEQSNAIKKLMNNMVQYIFDNNPYKNYCWRIKTPKRIEFDEWYEGKIIYLEWISNHMAYKTDFLLCSEFFNWNKEENNKFYEFNNYINLFYKLDYKEYEIEFKLYEKQKYFESKEEWKIRDAEWIKEKDEKQNHNINHHSIDYHEKEIKKLDENYKGISCREDYIKRQFKDGILISTEVDDCKYCIEVKKLREEEPIRIKLEKEKERLEEEELLRKTQEWENQRKEELQNRELYICKECNYSTYNAEAFDFHQDSKEHKKLIELHKYYCEDCEIQTRNQMEYNIHIQTKKHKIKIGELEKQEEFKCELCNYITRLKQNWEKHMNTKIHINNMKK